MARIFTTILLMVILALPAASVSAVQPDEILENPALERRARDISQELRCLVCQNQSIDDSDAPLAKDLRLLVRERLKQGDTDAEVVDFVVARYGEFVLLRPRFVPHTLILWLAPPLLFLLGVFVLFRNYRRQPDAAMPNGAGRLSAKERRELNKLLKKS